MNDFDVIIIAVAHNDYSKIKKENWEKMLKSKGIIIDIKSILPKGYFSETKIAHWRM